MKIAERIETPRDDHAKGGKEEMRQTPAFRAAGYAFIGAALSAGVRFLADNLGVFSLSVVSTVAVLAFILRGAYAVFFLPNRVDS